MADIKAIKTGNWSDPTVWSTGALPNPGDVAASNNFVVTIDQDIPALISINNGFVGSATAGGYFVVSSIPATRTLYINPVAQVNGSAVLAVTAPSGTLVINGNIAAASWINSTSIEVSGTCNVVINGSLTGGTANSGVTAMRVAGSPTITINGNLNGGSDAALHLVSGVPAITINGDLTGHITQTIGYGLKISTNANVIINGKVKAQASHGIYINAANYTLRISDLLSPSQTANAIYAGTSVGNIIVCSLEHAPNNMAPIFALAWMIKANTNVNYKVRNDLNLPSSGLVETLVNYYTNSPAPNNVRDGITYGANNTIIGTLKVPNPAAVSMGVQTDNTTGTATLDLAKVAELVGNQIAAAFPA